MELEYIEIRWLNVDHTLVKCVPPEVLIEPKIIFHENLVYTETKRNMRN